MDTKKENDKMYTILIKRKKRKEIVKTYHLQFENSFDAFEWGERQAKEFGEGHFAELGKK